MPYNERGVTSMDNLMVMYLVGVVVGFMIRPVYNWLIDMGETTEQKGESYYERDTNL